MFEWITKISNTNRPFFSKRKIKAKPVFGVNPDNKEWELLGFKEIYLKMLSIYIPFRKIKNQRGILFSKMTEDKLKITFF